jgi:hypothetical protein
MESKTRLSWWSFRWTATDVLTKPVGQMAAPRPASRESNEILRREAEPVDFVGEPFCLRWRKIDGGLHADDVPWCRRVQQSASADRLRRSLSAAFGGGRGRHVKGTAW